MPRFKDEMRLAMKGHIENGVIELLIKSRIENISIAQIAKKLGVSSVTIYNYYANRGEIVQAILKRSRDKLYQELTAIIDLAVSPEENLLKLATVIFNQFEKNKNLFMARYTLPITDTDEQLRAKEKFSMITDIFANEIERGIANKDFRQVEASASAIMMFGAIMSINRHTHFNWLSLSVSERLSQFKQLIIEGLKI